MPGDHPLAFANVLLFEGLDDEALAALERASSVVHVPARNPLFLQGDAGDAMYLLTEGRLEVRVSRDGHDAAIDTVTPPALVGETALLTGRPRSATVVATEDAALQRLPAAAFTTLVQEHPLLLARLEEAMRPRLRRTHLAPLLHDWFGVRDAPDVAGLEADLEWVELASGETLFTQGDPGVGVYLVVSGRLRLERTRPAGAAGQQEPAASRVVGEVAPGESTGETSMLLGSGRTATARALRDTRLVRVPLQVAERHAPFMTRLARVVADRSQRREDGRGRGRPPRTFALLGLTDDAPLAEVAAGIVDGLAEQGGAEIVDRRAIQRAFDLPDVADAARGEAAALVLGDWLDRQERAHAHLLYVTDDRWTPWSERCVRQADRVVLVADTASQGTPEQVAKRVRALAPDTPIELLLLRPDEVATPSGTAAWLDRVGPHAHHHVRLGDPGELRRAARRIAGKGRILVLSGGGARGYVHIGLLAAIEAAGVEVDAVAGTSMGALVGGAYAMSRSAGFAEASARRFGDPKRIVDRTLPIVSIARSRGLSELLREMFGDALIEDVATPFFCVASNLSRAEPWLLDRGPLWRAIRGSSAIPGVFSPIVDDGDLIVDGGVMNNFPVDLARERFGDGPLIASNAYGRERGGQRYAFPDELSGWSVLAQRLLPRSRRTLTVPSILSTLTKATGLNSHFLMERLGQGADLLVRYPTDGVGSLEFDRVDELIEMGRTHADAALASWAPAPVSTG